MGDPRLKKKKGNHWSGLLPNKIKMLKRQFPQLLLILFLETEVQTSEEAVTALPGNLRGFIEAYI